MAIQVKVAPPNSVVLVPLPGVSATPRFRHSAPRVFGPIGGIGEGSELVSDIDWEENFEQGTKAEEEAERAELEELLKIDPDAKLATQVRLYNEATGRYMVSDILITGGGVTHIHIKEIKSGDAKLSERQIEVLSEALKSGRIYVVNEDKAEKLRIKPRMTFLDQKIIPLVTVQGGSEFSVDRPFKNNGLMVLPKGAGRIGRIPDGAEPE